MSREENKKKLITYGMYCNFIKEVQHFDNLQTHFRLLSSTILLGSIAAIGFLFSLETLTIPLGKSFVALLVSFIGITSLLTLWYVDLKLYERLLVSNFAEAYRLEKENDWLPKVHHNMLFASHKKDHPSNLAYYYIGCVETLILTIGLTITYDLYIVHKHTIWAVIALAFTFVLGIIFYLIIKRKTQKINDLLIQIGYIKEE